jgi:uracil-DNA glycosylase
MLVWELPGDQKDLAREPFVGPAGQLLRQVFPSTLTPLVSFTVHPASIRLSRAS